MLGFLLILWTVCSSYIFYKLIKKKMYLASLSISALYFFIVSWTLGIFYDELFNASKSFSEHISLLFDYSYSYIIFIQNKFNELPFGVFISLVIVLVLMYSVFIYTLLSCTFIVYKKLIMFKPTKFKINGDLLLFI